MTKVEMAKDTLLQMLQILPFEGANSIKTNLQT
jgi:hypothetical protein